MQYNICDVCDGTHHKKSPGLIKWKIKLKFTKTKNFSQFEFEPRTP